MERGGTKMCTVDPQFDVQSKQHRYESHGSGFSSSSEISGNTKQQMGSPKNCPTMRNDGRDFSETKKDGAWQLYNVNV
jgi:hypothetical protein